MLPEPTCFGEGKITAAVEAYTLAIDLSTNPAEKSYLRARRQDLQPS